MGHVAWLIPSGFRAADGYLVGGCSRQAVCNVVLACQGQGSVLLAIVGDQHPSLRGKLVGYRTPHTRACLRIPSN